MKTEPITTKTNNEAPFRSRAKIRLSARCVIIAFFVVINVLSAWPSFAVPFTFTLTGVTFDDGATASGFFVLDPTTGTYGPFDITTSAGLTFTGSQYSPGVGTAPSYLSSPDSFSFDNFSIDSHYLNLSYSGHITSTGLYTLDPGSSNGPGSFSGSSEFVDSSFDYRLIKAGALLVTSTASVPETEGTVLYLAISLAALSGLQRLSRRQSLCRTHALGAQRS